MKTTRDRSSYKARAAKLPLALAVAGLTALGGAVSPASAQSGPYFDAKTLGGNACQYIDHASPDTIPAVLEYNNPLKYDTRGVINVDAGYTHISCPVVRDNTRNTNGVLGAKVFVNNIAGKLLTCKLTSRDKYGALIAVDEDETILGGNRTLSLDVDASATWGNYSIYCRIGKGTRVYSYRVTEFLGTDSNN